MKTNLSLSERMGVSRSHISDRFSEAFIASLHRSQGSNRSLVRHPSPSGEPYKVSNHRYRIRGFIMNNPEISLDDITDEIEQSDDEALKQLHNYYQTHWNKEGEFK